MAEADSTLMLEILKDIRKDVTDIRKEQKDVRKEQDNHRSLLLLTVDSVRRLQLFTEQKFLDVEKRFHDVEERMRAHKDDLAMMLKAELLGAMTNFQIRIENYVHERLAERAE